MYNRYTPKPDGTYQRKQLQDTAPRPEIPRQNIPEPAPACPLPEPPRCPPAPPRPRPRPCREPESTTVTGFLKQLLPRNFDTTDLLVVLLLLLMSGECQEDQNTALLTLALYLFL